MNQKRTQQISLFEDFRLDLQGAIDLSLMSLQEYGRRYRHWACAYSGGKDSSATVTFVAWAIQSGLVPAPKSLTILYSDTRQELPPLQQTAVRLLGILSANGFSTRIVTPALNRRFYVYMFGRGVPPPRPHFQWCTGGLKVEPMMAALEEVAQPFTYNYQPNLGYIKPEEPSITRYYEPKREKILMITGMRLGESAVRDQRIALSCSRDKGECGQGMFHDRDNEGEKTAGWFQPTYGITDTLAPLVHWRLCHVYDWIYIESDRHGYNVDSIAVIYGEDEVRTGCIGCNLASKDVALLRLIKSKEWAHLSPLLELRELFAELVKPKWRLRKSEPEYLKDGKPVRNLQRLGPLTMEGRAYGLEKVLDIQRRARVDLINAEEEARIKELWALNTWPDKWNGDEVTGDTLIDAIRSSKDGSLITVQSLLVR